MIPETPLDQTAICLKAFDDGQRSVSPMMDNTRVFKLAAKTAVQQLGDGEGAVILELDTGQLHTCNDTTAAFLAHVDGTRTFASLLDTLEDVFHVSREQLRSDLSQLAENLHAKGLIE